MPEQTRFDVDELFHTADVPDMSVDTPAVVTAGAGITPVIGMLRNLAQEGRLDAMLN